MKFLFNIFLMLLFSFALQGQGWQQIADFPETPRDDGTAFVIGNKAFCVTGLEEWNCTRNGAVFDGNTESWSSMNNLPVNQGRQYACSFSYGGFGYIFGGIDCSNPANYLNDLWRYDPINDSWQTMQALPDTGRSGASCFIIGDKAYIVGGKNDSSSALREVWEYNINTDLWQKKNDLPFAGCWRGNSFVINDTSSFLCYGKMNNDKYVHQIYKYDRGQDTWTPLPGLSLPARTYAGCAVVYNKACLYGGQDSAGTNAVELLEFNPALQTITSHTGIPSAVYKGGMAFSLNNMFYYTTGVDTFPSRVKQTWRSSHVTGIDVPRSPTIAVKIFPQPFNKNISVTVIDQIINRIQLLDIFGKKVYEINGEKKSEITLQIEGLAQGVYFLSIILNSGEAISKKILKVNTD